MVRAEDCSDQSRIQDCSAAPPRADSARSSAADSVWAANRRDAIR